jgi:hypothetical protein
MVEKAFSCDTKSKRQSTCMCLLQQLQGLARFFVTLTAQVHSKHSNPTHLDFAVNSSIVSSNALGQQVIMKITIPIFLNSKWKNTLQ